jgi:hypothetical protein
MKGTKYILGLAVLAMAPLAVGQITIGENTKLSAGGLATFGYQGDYGDDIQSSHGITAGFDGKISGSYYNPNFLSFTANPYYNQSRADSNYQSLTGASGVNGTANFFTGSHFPGSVNYHYDANSTGTFGLIGQPNFTTVGRSQGFGVNWSAIMPDLPTIAVGFSEGSGHSTLYGTDEEANSSSKLFNVHSNYQIEGFRLNGYYDHNSLKSAFPEFLASQGQSSLDSNGQDFGFGAQHSLPIHGSFYASYYRSTATSNYVSEETTGGSNSNDSNYTSSNESVTASFHPVTKLNLNVTQNYVNNLTGYLAQTVAGNGVVTPGINLGSGSYSSTFGGGATYNFTNYLSASGQATYYQQHYFGKSYDGTYLAGTLNYGKRLWDTFTFSMSVIDSSNGQGTNAVGFVGNINFFRRFGLWQTSGQFSYAQNVQTLLVTYTNSYYNYSANLRRRLPAGMTWIAAFNGNHSGLTNYAGTSNHGESYSTSLSMRRLDVNGYYTQSNGISLLGSGGIVTPTPTPGVTDYILFNGSSYGGGISVTPARRLSIAGTFSRAISDTVASTYSHNNTEIFNAQMQYHLRRIGLLAGYTRFTQGISAVGAPANTTTYFVGVSRWFDFF